MTRHRPDSLQGLFRWVWSDPEDDRPDDVDDDPAPEPPRPFPQKPECKRDRPDGGPEPDPPPLRGRVRQRHGPRTRTLWGVPIILHEAPGRR